MSEPEKNTREAMLWEPLEGKKVRCNLCGHRCVIQESKYGICGVRENVAGELRTHTYGRLVAIHVDPIEKKPLFHFLPGSRSLSIAAAGCNFQCAFCQNWQISQPSRDVALAGEAVSPDQVITAAVNYDCRSISYTYTEPTIFFEMAYDTCKLAREKNIRNCFVSNGYLTPLAVRTVAPVLGAINVDLKAFRDETYRRIMKARLEPVLTCLKELVQAGVWVEVTTLVVPDMNDSREELRDIARFIATDLGRHVPWHVSRFHGDYKMTDVPATPLTTLTKAVEIGRQEGLKFIYCGNAPGQADESTYCPSCQNRLIEREGFFVRANVLAEDKCPQCAVAIEGIWR